MNSDLVLRDIKGGRLVCAEGFPWLCSATSSSFHSPIFHKYDFPEFQHKAQKERHQIEKQTRSFSLVMPRSLCFQLYCNK